MTPIRSKKTHLLLRDDLSREIDEYISRLENKLLYLKKIESVLKVFLISLKTGKSPDHSGFFAETGHYMTEVCAADYEIGQKIDRICRILSIKPHKLKTKPQLLGSKAPEIAEIENSILSATEYSASINDEIIQLLEKEKAECGKNADDLKRIIQLNQIIKLPRD